MKQFRIHVPQCLAVSKFPENRPLVGYRTNRRNHLSRERRVETLSCEYLNPLRKREVTRTGEACHSPAPFLSEVRLKSQAAGFVCSIALSGFLLRRSDTRIQGH